MVHHSPLASLFLWYLPPKLNIAAARSFCWAYVAWLMGLCVLPAAGGAVGRSVGRSMWAIKEGLSLLLPLSSAQRLHERGQ